MECSYVIVLESKPGYFVHYTGTGSWDNRDEFLAELRRRVINRHVRIGYMPVKMVCCYGEASVDLCGASLAEFLAGE